MEIGKEGVVMKRFKPTRSIFLLSTTVFLGVLLALAAPASSAWWWTHGHSGVVQDPGLVTEFFMGWGLDFTQNSGTSTWIHYAVPTLGDSSKGAQTIRIRCYFGSIDAFITNIDVWNGGTRITAFTTDYTANNAYRTITLDLGSLVKFDRGLGVSINTAAGVEMMDHRIIINGVGANFVTVPTP
jgi:Na+-translocating ferredoxin:NAD+ oxidoreductase RnfD subunit